MPLWNGIETNVSGDNNARNKPEVRGIWNEIIFAPIPFECDGALSVTESSILSLRSWRYFTGNSNYIVYSQVIESKNDPRFTVFYRTAALITMKLMQNSTDYVKTEQLLYMHLSIYWEPRKGLSPLSCSLRVQSVCDISSLYKLRQNRNLRKQSTHQAIKKHSLRHLNVNSSVKQNSRCHARTGKNRGLRRSECQPHLWMPRREQYENV